MITITWYNLVAIVVGLLFILWLREIDDSDLFAGFFLIIWLACALVFFAVWGGFFWW